MAEKSKKTRYGVSTFLYEKQDLNEALSKIASAGFSYVELWANEYHLDPRVDPDLKSIQRAVHANGLSVDSIHTPFSGLNIGYPDASLLPLWLDIMEKCFGYCCELGAHHAVVHLSSHDQPLPRRQETEARQLVEKFVHHLVDRGSRFGVGITLENLPGHGTPDYILSLESLSQIFEGEGIGFCLDVGHAAINGFDIDREIAAAGNRLQSVHVSNNDGIVDMHWQPYEGVLNWDRIESTLRDSGYKGPLFLEVNGGVEPDKVLEKIRCFAGRDWAKPQKY